MFINAGRLVSVVERGEQCGERHVLLLLLFSEWNKKNDHDYNVRIVWFGLIQDVIKICSQKYSPRMSGFVIFRSLYTVLRIEMHIAIFKPNVYPIPFFVCLWCYSFSPFLCLYPPPLSPMPSPPLVNPHIVFHVHGSCIYVLWLISSPSLMQFPFSPSTPAYMFLLSMLLFLFY